MGIIFFAILVLIVAFFVKAYFEMLDNKEARQLRRERQIENEAFDAGRQAASEEMEEESGGIKELETDKYGHIKRLN